jgi:hypothetical protein
MEFQINYGNLAGPARAAQRAPLWAAIDGRVSPLAGDEVVFFDPHTGRSHVMTAQVLQALDLCRSFQPLSVHVETVAASLPGLQGRQAAVKPVLESLQTRGLLLSEDAYLARLGSASGRTPAPLAGLFVRACDRPAQLSTLLASLATRASTLAPCQRLVVVDDSSTPAAAAAHAQLLREFARRWPQPVHHIVGDGWRGIVDDICAALPEHADALTGVLRTNRSKRRGSGGSGRNLITLLAAGCRYLIVDDDNLLPLHRLSDGPVTLDPRPPVSRVRTFTSHGEALAAGEADESGLGWHFEVCGRALGEVLGEGRPLAFGHAQLQGFAPSRSPAMNPDARIALTVNGHRGGSCSASPHWLLSLDGAARAGLCASEAQYLESRGDASVWAGYENAGLTRMATISPFAVDNSQLMPCSSPYGRAEDLVYVALVAAGDGSSLQLLAPHALGHLPEAGRDRREQLARARSVGFGQCIGELIGTLAGDLQAADPALRYRAVAARLDDLAGASDSALQAYLREYLVYERALVLRQLQEALPAAQDAPEALRADIRAQIELNARAVVERGVPRFTDVGPEASAEQCAAAFRDEIATLTAGLRAWPAAWQLALERREAWLEQGRLPS